MNSMADRRPEMALGAVDGARRLEGRRKKEKKKKKENCAVGVGRGVSFFSEVIQVLVPPHPHRQSASVHPPNPNPR